ncbi:MAG: hypothetical protein IPL06_07705 [Betaproteobacteria bacterium]|nr:hypothetical protein [Betaproteobacteria bacterium]
MVPRNRQAGLAAATIVILLVLGLVALILGARYFDSALGLDQRTVTEANMRRIAESLSRFATLNQRIPCPAAGNVDAGTENAVSPFATCNSPDGVVPWAALALRRDEILDGWGRKISYRVFSGNTGFTQVGGTSMSDCNVNGAASDTVNASGLCQAARQTPPAAFLAGKGLSIQGDAATTGGFAFVLISHGESGLGAFAAEGTGRSALPSAGSLELPNAQAGATFNQRSRSPPGVAPTDVAHFDDTVLAVSITDVVNAAKLTARDWGAPPASASQVFTAAAIAAAGGAGGYNTGQTTLTFGSGAGAITVTAIGDSGRNVGFNVDTGTGIGSIGTSSNSASAATANRATNEGLVFTFAQTARYLGVTLGRFGDQSGERERVSFDFIVGGSTIRVTKTACRNGDGRVNFTLNPGGDFTEVTIEPRLTASFNYDSTLNVQAIAACPSSNPSCKAPGAIAGEDCP